MMNKRIFTAALTGAIHTPSMSPYLPITPEQIIEEAVRVYEAGGAVAHVHVRDPKTGLPNADQSIFREIADELGIDAATPDEARQILGLKGSSGVGF